MREDEDIDQDDEEDDMLPEETPVTSGAGGPDYEHLLNVISEGFNKLISTFYTTSTSTIIG